MRSFTVFYADELMVGNQTETMEIDAPNLESAYEIINEQYPDLIIDQVVENR